MSSVVVIVFVALVLLALLLRSAGQALMKRGIAAAADEIERELAFLVSETPHDFAVVDGSARDDEARVFVDSVTPELAALGFTLLGDVEDRTLSRHHPEHRTIVRVWRSEDGVIVAGAWRRPAAAGPAIACVEFSTELRAERDGSDDVRFVETVRCPEIPGLDMPPNAQPLRLPEDTPLATMLTRHREAIAAAATPPCPVHTIDDVIQAAHRKFALVARFRQGLKPIAITREELRRLAGSDVRAADTVHDELCRRTKEKR